jgi:phosphoribosylformylglycinamidine synthase
LHDLNLNDYPLDRNWNETLLQLLSAPNICRKGWVYDQYDSMVRTNTSVGPGSDAAVLRLRKTNKALAMTTDCNGRYCYANPRVGASSAVAEAARNIVCSGGKPLAITNCLNFGNPYKPEVYFGFVEAIAGMGEACRVFGTPVTGGNVSFYNEDPERAVFPSPVIGMVGLIEDLAHITTQWFKDEGDAVYLIGANKEELGVSEYLHTVFKTTKGNAPSLNLAFEAKLQDVLLDLIRSGLIKSAHDCAEGGLAVALAESCISNQDRSIGCTINLNDSIRTDCLLFGETQSRVIVSCSSADEAQIELVLSESGLPYAKIGKVGGDRLKIEDLIDIPLEPMHRAFYEAMTDFMEQSAATVG